MTGRTDAASRVVAAAPAAIYRAFLDPDALAAWRPPTGMHARILSFDPRPGGVYRMAFVYDDLAGGAHGKSADDADLFEGRFTALDPDRRIVEVVEFESDDPAFAGTMTVTTTLAAVAGGTEVRFVCENVPEGISAEDHRLGMESSLENLARFVE